MPSGSIYELAILLTLKDAASGGLGRVEDRLRAAGREGRATLKTFQDLRADLKRDLTVAGIGIGTLAMMRGGIKVAGDFEAAMSDLRMSIAQVGKDGKTDLRALQAELNQYEKLGMDLGNQLPGSTQDFIKMFSTLKQGGLQSQSILNGTGQAVAHLAVVTGNIPADLAEPFSQYAAQFQLTGDEAIKLADVLARLRFATGLRPQELIEGSKFFQLRAGSTLGLKGLSGAEISGRLLATLRTFGLEGGIGGRELGSFIIGLGFNTKEQKEALAELKSGKGIDLKFFEKGQFLGVENMFAQMEKMRKLTTEERLQFGEKLFNRETLGIMNVMLQSGVEGWRKINGRIDQVAPLQDLINEKTSTYNAKLEAVQGTLSNLAATAFTPMLDSLKPALDHANQMAGSMQQWSKANPEATGTISSLVAMSGVTLTLVGGIRAMTTAWRLWRIASSVGVNEAGQLTFLRTLRAETAATSTTMGVAGGKAGLYSRAVGSIPSAVSTTIVLVGIEYALSKLYELTQATDDWNAALRGEDKANRESIRSLLALKEEYSKGGTLVPAEVHEQRALAVLESLNRKTLVDDGSWEGKLAKIMGMGAPQGELSQALESGTHFLRHWNALFTLSPGNPYTRGTISGVFDVKAAAETFKQRAPELAQPEVMRAFIERLKETGLSQDKVDKVLESLRLGFSKSFDEASKAVKDNTQTSQSLTQIWDEMLRSSTELPPFLARTGESASRASANLDRFSNRLSTFQFPFGPGGPSGYTSLSNGPLGPLFDNSSFTSVPSRQTGGMVRRGGMVEVHDREAIVPADVTERFTERRSDSRSANITINYSPRLEVHGGDVAEFERQLAKHAKELAEIIAREIENQRERS